MYIYAVVRGHVDLNINHRNILTQIKVLHFPVYEIIYSCLTLFQTSAIGAKIW